MTSKERRYKVEKIITYLNDKELTVKLGKAEQTSECKDPEPAQVKQETKAEGPKQAEKATGQSPIDTYVGYLQVVAEIEAAKQEARSTGTIPQPSEALLQGYQAACSCGICGHIRAWQSQEDRKTVLAIREAKKTREAEVDRVTKALQDLSKGLDKPEVKQSMAAFKSNADNASFDKISANVTQSQETNKENQAMANNEKPVADNKPAARVPSQIELEARAAALRTGMKQLTKLIHEPLAAALAAQLTPPGSDPSAMKAQVAAFLKSELGSAVVSAMLSLAINSIPANMIPGFTAERQSLVAQELRVKAMTEVGDTLVDLVAAPLRTALAGLMTGPGAEALTGVRAEDAGLDGATTAQEEATTTAQADNVKRVSFG